MKKLTAMTLGTVQLGLNYGIANLDGKPDEKKSFDMLRTALENGVTSIDTARTYGNSEEVIGRFFKTWEGELPYITTKVKFTNDDTEYDVEAFAINSIEESLERLGVKKVDCVLVHSPLDLLRHQQKLADAMEKILKMGYTDKVGVSVYNQNEVEEMFKYPVFSATQVPMSIFDQRLIASKTVDKLKERDCTVFVRSVFLQGVFFLNPDTIDDPILIEHAVPKIRLINEIAAAEGLSVAELAIAFMRDTTGVTSLVLGADTPQQVLDNISYLNTPTLSDKVKNRLMSEFANVDIPEIMKVLTRPKPQN